MTIGIYCKSYCTTHLGAMTVALSAIDMWTKLFLSVAVRLASLAKPLAAPTEAATTLL